MDIVKGRLLLLGRNIDTDQIYPGRYLELVEKADIAKHCLEGVDPAIAGGFEKGGLIAAGPNFGCGSSREHAPIALLGMGVSAVIADSFARIFFRNSINLGLPLIVCPGISEIVNNGELIEANIVTGEIILPERGVIIKGEAMGAHAMEILSAGGIKPLMRKKLADSTFG
jgi:3-isopropylmalate/(R)-2-methylmalate dehydratase small subunit